jgi:hypothetical protein
MMNNTNNTNNNNYIEYKLDKYITKIINNPSNILTYLDKFNQYSKLKKYHNKLYFLNSNNDKYQTYLQKYYYYLDGGKQKSEDEKEKEEKKKVFKKLIKADEIRLKSGIELTKAEETYFTQKLILQLNGIRAEFNDNKLKDEIKNEKESNDAYKKDESKKIIKDGLQKISKLTKIIFESNKPEKVKKAKEDKDEKINEINNALQIVHPIEQKYIYNKILVQYEKTYNDFINKLTKSLKSKLKKSEKIKKDKEKEYNRKAEDCTKALEEFNKFSKNKLEEVKENRVEAKEAEAAAAAPAAPAAEPTAAEPTAAPPTAPPAATAGESIA